MPAGALTGIVKFRTMAVKIATYLAITSIFYGMYYFWGTNIIYNIDQMEQHQRAVREPQAHANMGFASTSAKITIAQLDIDDYLVLGAQAKQLRRGPGVLPGSVSPGQQGNLVIAGHRATWGAPFRRLDELQVGDDIRIRDSGRESVYRVIPAPGGELGQAAAAYQIVSPEQVQVAEQLTGVSRLTLITCHPKWSSSQRLIVVAELVGEPPRSVPASLPAVATRLDQLGFSAPDRSWGWVLAPGVVAWSIWGVLTMGIRRSGLVVAIFRYVIATLATMGPLLIFFTRLDQVPW